MTIAFITINPLAIVAEFGIVPPSVTVPGIGVVHAVSVGWTNGNYMLVDVAVVGQPVDQFSQLQDTALSLSGSTLTKTMTYSQRTPTATELKAYASQKQRIKAQAGKTLGATPIPTDLTTQVLLAMAFTKASNDSNFNMGWVGSSGPITLTAANILNAARQVGTFLGQCKNAEATSINSVNAGTITGTTQIDTLFNF